MLFIGREKELQTLNDCLHSGRPEFVVIYGRRRVGKTYLVRQFFAERFSFYATGAVRISAKEKLKLFHRQLREQGGNWQDTPEDWFEAFSRLRQFLCNEGVYREPTAARRIVFLDELPWMDSSRSDFLPALDYFWNSWASMQSDLMLVVCGSATSWIIEHILNNTGGLYNRITRRIHLQQFSLRECEQFFRFSQFQIPRQQIIESYMVFGGIPYYLNYLNPRLSLAQNVEELCVKPSGQLYDEYNLLLSALFLHHEKHAAILETLSARGTGMTRAELEKHSDIGGGGQLTKALLELEQCDFVRKYKDYSRNTQRQIYQLKDPFLLFCFRFLKKRELSSWITFRQTPAFYAWSGIAFETVCLHHVEQIKEALGIRGIETYEYSWRSERRKDGAQIDLVIDRKDNVINLCEMKFTQEPYDMNQDAERELIHKREVFREETGLQKALFLTLVSAQGTRNQCQPECIQNLITGDDLFRM